MEHVAVPQLSFTVGDLLAQLFLLALKVPPAVDDRDLLAVLGQSVQLLRDLTEQKFSLLNALTRLKSICWRVKVSSTDWPWFFAGDSDPKILLSYWALCRGGLT